VVVVKQSCAVFERP